MVNKEESRKNVEVAPKSPEKDDKEDEYSFHDDES